jgi:TolB-like protein/DNA-binding winged helix-turn-helix (wHTH) protein/cytochrome c-type biogenesis protein CcmH/NrfG
MANPAPAPKALRFALFEIDLQAGELRKSGARLKLQEQPLQILIALLLKPGEVVTREELRKKLWDADTFVDFEHSLGTAINKIREVLGDSAEKPRFIETLPRRGYRFVAPVERIEGSVAPRQEPPARVAKATRRSRRAATWLAGLATASAILVLLAGLYIYRGWRLSHAASSELLPRSLAVLPLVNLSRDPEQEYFADGMTDELITDLAQIRALRVISRTSAMQYKEAHKSLGQIARELNVEAIIEGTVLRSGDKVRITAQLIQVPNEKHLWARSYEGDLRDVVALQDRVAHDIAAQIRIELTPQDQARLGGSRPVDSQAYEAYLKGRYYWDKMSIDGFTEGRKYFQESVTRDPDYALAYAGLSDSYQELSIWGALPPLEASPKSEAAAQKALSIDDSLAQAHAALGNAHFLYDWKWSDAEREFKRAVELDPQYATAHIEYAVYLSAMGRQEEAVAEAKQAHVLDPVSQTTNSLQGLVYFLGRRFDEAISQLQNTIALYPDTAINHDMLAACYEQKKMYSEAMDEYRKAGAIGGLSSHRLAALRQAFAASGFKGYLQEELKSETAESQRLHPYASARLYARLGQRDLAFHWLEKAYLARSHDIAFIKVHPELDNVRTDPRFQDLLRRVGFPQ